MSLVLLVEKVTTTCIGMRTGQRAKIGDGPEGLGAIQPGWEGEGAGGHHHLADSVIMRPRTSAQNRGLTGKSPRQTLKGN